MFDKSVRITPIAKSSSRYSLNSSINRIKFFLYAEICGNFPCLEVIGFLNLSHKFLKTCLKCSKVSNLKFHFYLVFIYQEEELERFSLNQGKYDASSLLGIQPCMHFLISVFPV